jgi:hypothetical protein
MPNWKSLTALSLVLSLPACGDAPSCAAGTVKKHGVCVDKDPASQGDGDEGDSRDAAVDASVDASCADGGCPCSPGALMYLDTDHDGVGAGEGVEGCPSGDYVASAGDCEPNNPLVFPGNPELCNGADEDCDDEIDEGVLVSLYVDMDGDGHGDKNDEGEQVCAGQSISGKVLSNDDCDDACETCSPANAVEMACDSQDDDCDGVVDDGVNTVYRLDCDGDGYLPSADDIIEMAACAPPGLPSECVVSGRWLVPSQVLSGVDCDPHNDTRYPGASEICDHLDNDCDTLVDDLHDVENALRVTYKVDCDGDGYVPVAAMTNVACPSDPRPQPLGCLSSGAGVEYNPQWLSPDHVLGQDCADWDKDAHPGSPTYSSDHVGGKPNDFDYNCDGQNTKVDRDCDPLEICGLAAHFCFTGGSVPACGQSGPVTRYTPSVITPGTCSIGQDMAKSRCK